MTEETSRIEDRYRRRGTPSEDLLRASLLLPHRLLSQQEKERAYVRFLRRYGPERLCELRVLEVGCGFGSNFLQFLRWGFSPANLVGVELMPDRHAHAREILPSAVTLLQGDAASVELPPGSFDLVLQSTVFSSILDPSFQDRLAQRMWALVAPGGGILWYDFVYDNPRNPDVRGVPRRRVGELFPEARPEVRRLTLAPPLARAVTRLHPALYGLFNAVPLLRSHLFCWLAKGR